tara:strand:+ start:5610 stop:6446 length:837 start_codon:yes stop_codon:yes gene_type:complete
MNIPIYIPSFNRAETIKTSRWLDSENVAYKVILHTEKCKKEYAKAGVVEEKDIIVSGAPSGISNQRNWIATNLGKRGEWFYMMDDNISGFNRVTDCYYHTHKQLDVKSDSISQHDYRQQVMPIDLLKLLALDIALAEKIGSEYIGYATTDNYFFNAKKYKSVGFIVSKAVAIKYSGLSYDSNIHTMDDYGFCVEQLIKNGTVLRNNWMKPIYKHYEAGGIGDYESRTPRKILDCEYLMGKYPALFRYKTKKGRHPKAELQMTVTSTKRFAEWKKDHYR